MDAHREKRQKRLRRHRRVRGKVDGSAEKPRLAVFKSNRHLYCQLIDDEKGHTLLAASSRTPGVLDGPAKGNAADAAKVGSLVAKKCKEAGITTVCFDRGGFKYHGRIKALADEARKGGLVF